MESPCDYSATPGPSQKITGSDDSIMASVKTIIRLIGENPEREGLIGTPQRVANSYNHLFSGYRSDVTRILATTFIEGSCKEMVILQGVEFYSTCEHHLLPFFGSVSIGYIPNGRVVGVSKLARLIEAFSRRLQVQERMTTQIADAIIEHLDPLGAIVLVEARHLCMTSRGVEKQGGIMKTSAIRGVFEDAIARQEFLEIIRR